VSKVVIQSESSKQVIQSESSKQVGLSCYAQSHRKSGITLNHFIEVSEYVNGECKIKYKQYFNSQSKPPTRIVGNELIQSGLNMKAKSKIKLAGRMIEYVNVEVKGRSGMASFVTLTYGKHVPAHKQAKKMLDVFLKRMRRYYGFNIEYVWVAELQKRGAIHFHILLPEYLDKVFINKAWNSIVNKWMVKEHGETQLLLPNVKAVSFAGSYITKYISKEENKIHGNMYGISTPLRKLMKPTISTTKFENEYKARELMDATQDTLDNLYLKAFSFNSGTTRQLWSENGLEFIKSINNDILINESINQ
jgi:hypothetical protein